MPGVAVSATDCRGRGPVSLESVMTREFSLDEANRMLPLVSRTLAMAAGIPVAPLVAAALLACVLRRARRA